MRNRSTVKAVTDDPVHDALAARRAAKRRRHKRPTEEQGERPAPALVSQGARSRLPEPTRAGPNELLREAAWAARGKPRWVRV